MYFLNNITTLQVFVTYLTGALYAHPLWFYKHRLENRVRSKQFVACQHVTFTLPFTAILVNCVPSGEMHNYWTPLIIKENFENFLIHRCNYTLLSQLYCVWQVVKTSTIILNNPVYNRKRVPNKVEPWTMDDEPCRYNKSSLYPTGLESQVLLSNSQLFTPRPPSCLNFMVITSHHGTCPLRMQHSFSSTFQQFSQNSNYITIYGKKNFH